MSLHPKSESVCTLIMQFTYEIKICVGFHAEHNQVRITSHHDSNSMCPEFVTVIDLNRENCQMSMDEKDKEIYKILSAV